MYLGVRGLYESNFAIYESIFGPLAVDFELQRVSFGPLQVDFWPLCSEFGFWLSILGL